MVLRNLVFPVLECNTGTLSIMQACRRWTIMNFEEGTSELRMQILVHIVCMKFWADLLDYLSRPSVRSQ